MAHYRKIDTRILLDKKYNQLSSDGRLVFLHLLIHPNLTSLGAMHASLAGIACELDWEMNRFCQAIKSVRQQGMVQYDEKARFIWLPNFLKYNPPESPNVIKSWETAVSYLPECDLQQQLMVFIQRFVLQLSPAYQEILPDCFRLAELSSEIAAPQAVTESLPEAHLENQTTLRQGSCQNQTTLLEGNLKKPLPLSEGILKNDVPLPESLNIKHKALNNKHKALSIYQEAIVLENNSEAKNNIGEEKNIVASARQKISKPPDVEVVEVFVYWQQTLGHPQAQLDLKRRQVIKNALASGYTVAQLQDAILGCSLTPHNMGENEQGQRYDGLQVILRNADQIDRFIRNCHNPPRRRTKADQLLADNLAAGERWLARFEHEEKIINATD